MCAGSVPSAVLEVRLGLLADDRDEVRERDVHVGAVQPPAGAEHRPHEWARVTGSARVVDLQPAGGAGALALRGVEPGVGDPRRRDLRGVAGPAEEAEGDGGEERRDGRLALDPGSAGLTQRTCDVVLAVRPKRACAGGTVSKLE